MLLLPDIIFFMTLKKSSNASNGVFMHSPQNVCRISQSLFVVFSQNDVWIKKTFHKTSKSQIWIVQSFYQK